MHVLLAINLSCMKLCIFLFLSCHEHLESHIPAETHLTNCSVAFRTILEVGPKCPLHVYNILCHFNIGQQMSKKSPNESVIKIKNNFVAAGTRTPNGVKLFRT